MVTLEKRVMINSIESENRSTAVDSLIQTLVDSNLARLLNQDERKWWMYHYEVQVYGSSSIVPPSSNPFLSVLPPDGGSVYEPLVMICHQTPSGSLIGCYGVWTVENCGHHLIEGIGCCNMDEDENECEGETCFCRKVEQ
ncbi:MAG: hypothetical protein EA362_00405 [Saprospirales bacterium]|nr:MAG: hypothetical protein EA362_00405 [Saprospirales bacterium]